MGDLVDISSFWPHRVELTTMSCTISLVAVEGPWAFTESKPKKKQQIFCRTFSTHNTYTSYLQQHMQWNSWSGAMRGGAALLRSQMNSH
jgi:hypothetical protein